MGIEIFKRPVRTTKYLRAGSDVRTTGYVDADGYMTAPKFVSTAGGLDEVVQTGTSTGGALNTYGISTITRKSSAGASTVLYTLAAPAAARVGEAKTIIMVSGTSTRTARVTLGAGCSFLNSSGSTTHRKATFNAGGDILILRAYSTTKWAVVSNVGSVAIATT